VSRGIPHTILAVNHVSAWLRVRRSGPVDGLTGFFDVPSLRAVRVSGEAARGLLVLINVERADCHLLGGRFRCSWSNDGPTVETSRSNTGQFT
jgi:hypothetical protein